MRASAVVAWSRELPRSSVLVFCCALLAAVQTVLGLVDAPLWTRLLAAVLVLALAGGSELDKLQTKRREEREAEESREAEWQSRAERSLRLWPAPSLAEADPHALGVARSRLAQRCTPANAVIAPYVKRDVDRLATKRLREQGCLLIVGAPASGATRTAYQVAPEAIGDRLVLAPEPPQGLATIIDELDVVSRLAPPAQLLLWLDRIDAFSGPGVTAAVLRRCRKASPGLRVVATISSTRYAAWASEHAEMAAEFGNPVTLERLPTPDERQRALAAYPGANFDEGIAAAFTATAALLTHLRAGHTACSFEPAGGDCGLARPVVEVALDWGCTDTQRPLPREALVHLVLQRLGKPQLDPSHMTAVLKWAATPLVQGAALLRVEGSDRGHQVVTAHAELVAIRHSETTGPAESVWSAALHDAVSAGDSAAVGRIGFRAHVEDHPEVAALAWARVDTIGEPGAEWLERAAAFSRQRQEPAAERLPRERLLELTEAAHGPASLETAVALINLAFPCSALMETEQALELLGPV